MLSRNGLVYHHLPMVEGGLRIVFIASGPVTTSGGGAFHKGRAFSLLRIAGPKAWGPFPRIVLQSAAALKPKFFGIKAELRQQRGKIG